MTQMHELFVRDPREGSLANKGQARISGDSSPEEQAILLAELSDFVCEGGFANVLEVILDHYLKNLNAAKQESAWISGFFGSGKSHLLKMLTHFWVNTEFEDGSRARDLPRNGLTSSIDASLRELDTFSKREKATPVAAAGTMLGGNDHVRLAVLAIVFRACGLPMRYEQAQFCLWLKEKEWFDAVKLDVESVGKSFDEELDDLYVSPIFAKCLLKLDPNFAADEKEARRVIRQQFPRPEQDITTREFIAACKQALKQNGTMPPTLIVLDEVQQYINQDSDRAGTIVELTEAIQSQFDNKVMLVAAGQSALTAGMDALSWLNDRFLIKCELTDAAVETVTRKVLLQKKPSEESAVKDLLAKHSGEVGRHLEDSKLADRPDDRSTEVMDYPLLSTRRRFWEECFRAVDKEGSQAQLRSQLRIVSDSLAEIADHDIGAVIPGSDLFTALAQPLVAKQVLLNQLSTRIDKLNDGTPDGKLRHDLCGLIFLIGKMPREEGIDKGVRATAKVLADLMVKDITENSAAHREHCRTLLEDMAESGVLMKVDDEYRMQTTEGAHWDQKFRENQTAASNSIQEVNDHRDRAFGTRLQKIVGGIKLMQGSAKVPRTVSLHAGNDDPTDDRQTIWVWSRDGWSDQESEVLHTARRLGNESPVLQVFLPQRGRDELRSRIIDAVAAQRTLDTLGSPTQPEGIDARQGMETRHRNAIEARDRLINDIFRAAKVFKGGGSEIQGEDLRTKLVTATEESIMRLFPRFSEGDHRAWSVAAKRAKDNSDTPFTVVDWSQATEDHPVAKEILSAIGSGAKGSELRKKFKSAPFGWPQDAIDAVLIALTQSGRLRATKDHQPITAAVLDGTAIGVTEFRSEHTVLAAKDKLALRGLFQEAGVSTKPGEESVRASDYLNLMRDLGSSAGGEAPLPQPPKPTMMQDLAALNGNDQLKAILDAKPELEMLFKSWKTLSERREKRLGQWSILTALCSCAAGLEGIAEVETQRDAICSARNLLDDTDHLSPLIDQASSLLRKAVTDLHGKLTDGVNSSLGTLESDSTWSKLSSDDRKQIIDNRGLAVPPPLSISSEAELLETLSERPMTTWRAQIDAVPSWQKQALQDAVELLKEKEPGVTTTTVAVERGTLNTPEDVDAWIEHHRKQLHEAIANGPVIVE
ncbi:MAG: BREX system P-loop protein BrxC [Phycisphaerales bacterium]